MVSCEDCGANIDANDNACPYCGHSVRQKAETHTGERTFVRGDKPKPVARTDRTYEVTRKEDGSTAIQFGEGITGKRPSSGAGIASRYRSGGGSSGNLSGILVEKLDQLYHQIEKGPDLSRHQGSKDVGVALMDYFAAMGDLLSLYQNATTREALLDTDDHSRLSMSEERIMPQLKTIVTFCDKVKSDTRKMIGLSGGDIKKIKKVAIKTLQMTEYKMCSRCGAMSKPGSKRCRKCKASL